MITKTFKKITPYLLSFVIALSFVSIGVFFDNPVSTQAGQEHNMRGWAWSDNIGWVSFNCTELGTCATSNYGVNISGANNVLSGYAWSDNVGWISFNEYDLFGCPSGTCRAWFENNQLKGWAKVLSGNDYLGDGFDGFISLDCETAGWCSGGSTDYGIDYTPGNKSFSGYAWGDSVVGWMNMSASLPGSLTTGVYQDVYQGDTATSTPTVSLTATPSSVSSGSNTTLSWQTSSVDSCNASGDWSGSKTLNSSELVGPITSVSTYNLNCTGVNGNADDSISVFVLPSDYDLASSGNISIVFGSATTATSTESTITVNSVSGFSHDVALSASSTSLPSGTQYIFSDTNLSSSEYSSGSTLKVYVPEELSAGNYVITITGLSNGLTRTTNVTLSVGSGTSGGANPAFEEF